MFDVNVNTIEEKIQHPDEFLVKEAFSLQIEPTVSPIAHLAQAINDFSKEESEEENPGVELYLDGLLFRF